MDPHLFQQSNRTISVKIRGGLGNQLFQLTACTLIARLSHRTVAFRQVDVSQNPHVEGTVHEKDTSHILRECVQNLCVADADVGAVHWNENDADPSPQNVLNRVMQLSNMPHVVLLGYFITAMFVVMCERTEMNFIHATFDVPSECLLGNLSQTFAVHVRRGDYLEEQWSWLRVNFHIEDHVNGYYARAMAQFPKTATAMVFSDDPEWCKQQTIFKGDRVVFAPSNISPLQTLHLMSRCKLGCVTANSTFSWWGAWLNDCSYKKMVMPLYWNNVQSANRIAGVFDIFLPGTIVLNN